MNSAGSRLGDLVQLIAENPEPNQYRHLRANWRGTRGAAVHVLVAPANFVSPQPRGRSPRRSPPGSRQGWMGAPRRAIALTKLYRRLSRALTSPVSTTSKRSIPPLSNSSLLFFFTHAAPPEPSALPLHTAFPI